MEHYVGALVYPRGMLRRMELRAGFSIVVCNISVYVCILLLGGAVSAGLFGAVAVQSNVTARAGVAAPTMALFRLESLHWSIEEGKQTDVRRTNGGARNDEDGQLTATCFCGSVELVVTGEPVFRGSRQVDWVGARRGSRHAAEGIPDRLQSPVSARQVRGLGARRGRGSRRALLCRTRQEYSSNCGRRCRRPPSSILARGARGTRRRARQAC